MGEDAHKLTPRRLCQLRTNLIANCLFDIICKFLLSVAESMSDSQESAVLSEVTKFLKRRRGDYRSLHELVNEELRRLKEQPKFHDAIYRIYSRQDKQIGGELLKDDWKIAKNLSELRADKRSISVGDIDDIIGVTVVTYFTSQRESICEALQSPGALRELEIVQCKPKNEKGYHAIHFITKVIMQFILLQSAKRVVSVIYCAKFRLRRFWTMDGPQRPMTSLTSQNPA
jgi:hypothetical protein